MRGLESLIRLHRWQLDGKRRQLAELQRLLAELTHQAAALEAEIAAEQRFAGGAEDARRAYPSYARDAIDRRHAIARSLADVEHSLTAAENEVAEAFQTLKTYETARDREAARERLAATRREQARLDEIAADRHRRTTANVRHGPADGLGSFSNLAD